MHGSRGRRRRLAQARRALALTMRVFKDGNAWCAVRHDYVDLCVSSNGWGGSPEEARRNLLAQEALDKLYPRRERIRAAGTKMTSMVVVEYPSENFVFDESVRAELTKVWNLSPPPPLPQPPKPKLTGREKYLRRMGLQS